MSFCHKLWFLTILSLQPDVKCLWYIKLDSLLDQIVKIWNIKGLHHQVVKLLGLDHFSLWEKLNFLAEFWFLFICKSVISWHLWLWCCSYIRFVILCTLYSIPIYFVLYSTQYMTLWSYYKNTWFLRKCCILVYIYNFTCLMFIVNDYFLPTLYIHITLFTYSTRSQPFCL